MITEMTLGFLSATAVYGESRSGFPSLYSLHLVVAFNILRIYAVWDRDWRAALVIAVVGYGIPCTGMVRAILLSWLAISHASAASLLDCSNVSVPSDVPMLLSSHRTLTSSTDVGNAYLRPSSCRSQKPPLLSQHMHFHRR